MPSVVAYDDNGALIVGERALLEEQRIRSIKRWITDNRDFVRVDLPTGPRDIRIDDLSVDVHGTLAAAPPRFESIVLEVRGRSADAATFDKLIQIAERGCIVHNTLVGGVRVEVTRR